MFFILGFVALVGMSVAHVLQKRLKTGIAERIAKRIKELDADLNLLGEEKTLSQLIDSSPEAKAGRKL